MTVPPLRIRSKNDAEIRESGSYVLYWMTSNRRLGWNYALDRACEHARSLDKPLLVLEALRCDYRWASERLHRFIVEGMRDNARAAAKMNATLYYPFVETSKGQGKGLLAALAKDACVVVGDDFPCFFLPRMQDAAARQLRVAFEVVDSNGIWPMCATDRVFTTAHSFRRHLQKELSPWLAESPVQKPMRYGHDDANVPNIAMGILKKWPKTDLDARLAEGFDDFPIEQGIRATGTTGGTRAARRALSDFLDARLGRYADERNAVAKPAASGLSPWLHFGHISAHEIFHELIDRESWDSSRLSQSTKGSREGWWNMSRGAEAFLDELITWREIGYNFASHRDDYDDFDALPDWAQQTMREHLSDERSYVYDLEEFAQAETHDEIWNAAQRELSRTGRMHNYLRMLWGKKVLEWTENPRDAAEILIELNNRFALDGRNPNSYSGIFWVFGRYDRAWGPERPIFGKIRYMSSDSTKRKLDLGAYLEEFSATSRSAT